MTAGERLQAEVARLRAGADIEPKPSSAYDVHLRDELAALAEDLAAQAARIAIIEARTWAIAVAVIVAVIVGLAKGAI